ncbi:flavonoid 3-monooxygenase [Iris pallida]|uniref:Flavonoid 3-monooxygenase n=1 Tax=Iris pallida TaxID=29817 RepID=A0AAX6GE03_IRIPA|nr:flavonoid 3-monooxygenase [Iris pallida]
MEFQPYAPYPTVLLLLLLLLLPLLLLLKFSRRRGSRNLPPGPKPWPVIGNLGLIGPLPHRSIHALSKKHGPIMQLRLGSFPTVVGSSVAAAKFFLRTHDLSFVGRPRTAAGRYTTYNYSDITWSPYGAYWRQARKMCLTELFSARRLASHERVRAEEHRGLVRELARSAGRAVVLKDFLSTLSLNVISRMVLGTKKYLHEEAGAAGAVVSPGEFKRMLDELFLLSGVLDVGDSIPWLRPLDLQGHVGRMKALSRKLDRFLERVLDEHDERRRGEGAGFVARDMVDVLLQLADDPGLEVKLSRDSVKAFTQDLLAGGTESSAVTVEWAISELLRSPDVIAKATEELDRVIGRDRWVDERDIHRLPYIESVVKETMRLHPVAPMLVPRVALEDASFEGYDIPAGTRVLVNVWTIGRDPEIWSEPDEFRPDRFMGRDIDVKGQDFELLPFGSGRRMCPGYNLGLKVIQTSLANLLHGFDWRLPEGVTKEGLDMEEVFGLSTPRKVPLEVVVEPRLPASMYEL